ncbi:MAG: DUF1152 domain-containing protein [Kofleriaceae bacterium]|nr:DUF1152 domain-containing protein [Kofleriaceae bacterium]
MLDQAVFRAVGGAKRVLIAGCGGSYDVMGAVPLLHALRTAGIEVELASLSFAQLNGLAGARRDPQIANLYAVGATSASPRTYCPEAHLAKFLDAAEIGSEHVIWCFDKTGVRPLAAAYAAVVERLSIDAIILVDGGIDALLRGDETSIGTPSEDLTSLAAATSLDIPTVLACVGMTTELREGIAHAQVFERIAELSRDGAYLGATALVPGTPACDLFVRALEAVFEGQSTQKQSQVHRWILRAIRGEFGTVEPKVWLSPLASMFWFFDARAVAATHHFLDSLRDTESIWDVSARIQRARREMSIMERTAIPI